MCDVALVCLVQDSESLYVFAHLVLAEVDGHGRFYLILEIQAHFAFEKLFGIRQLFLQTKTQRMIIICRFLNQNHFVKKTCCFCLLQLSSLAIISTMTDKEKQINKRT